MQPATKAFGNRIRRRSTAQAMSSQGNRLSAKRLISGEKTTIDSSLDRSPARGPLTVLISIKSRHERVWLLDLPVPPERIGMSQPSDSKSMTTGESGLALTFAVTAFLCMIGAAKALDMPFAFHASLASAASLACARAPSKWTFRSVSASRSRSERRWSRPSATPNTPISTPPSCC
jgi:hypothetical protein